MVSVETKVRKMMAVSARMAVRPGVPIMHSRYLQINSPCPPPALNICPLSRGLMNFAQVMLLQMSNIIEPKNHFHRFNLNAPTNRKPTRNIKVGIRNAGKPKQHLIKKYEMYAPMLPQLFCIAISSFLISPGSGLVMMLWSFCPVEKKEQNDQNMKMEMPKRISPTVTLVFSLCMKDETPMASLNDTFLELAVSFFFFAIFLSMLLFIVEVRVMKAK